MGTEPGARLHRFRLVRRRYIVLLLALTAAPFFAGRAVWQLATLPGFILVLVGLFSLPSVLRTHISALHENGLFVSERLRRRFVPWSRVRTITLREQSTGDATVTMCTVDFDGGAASFPLQGVVDAETLVKRIATEAGLVWHPDGRVARRP